MKCSVLVMSILVSLAGVAPALAEEQATAEKPAETVAPDSEASSPVNPETPQLMSGKGMMHGGGRHGKGQGGMMHCGCQHGKGQGGMMHGSCQHGKGQGGMNHGGGRHGKGQGGMMHGGGRHGKGGHEKGSLVVQRLDMIEARMAKIEAMLETLIQR